MKHLTAHTVDEIINNSLKNFSIDNPAAILHTMVMPGKVSNVICNAVINLDPSLEGFYLFLVDSDESVLSDIVTYDNTEYDFRTSDKQYNEVEDHFKIMDINSETLLVEEATTGDYVLFFWNDLGNADHIVYYIVLPGGSHLLKTVTK